MQNGDKALSSIILAGRGILVKMLITLEPHHIFYAISHAYLCFSTVGVVGADTMYDGERQCALTEVPL